MTKEYLDGYMTVSDLLEATAKEVNENTTCAEHIKLAHNITKHFAQQPERELQFSGDLY